METPNLTTKAPDLADISRSNHDGTTPTAEDLEDAEEWNIGDLKGQCLESVNLQRPYHARCSIFLRVLRVLCGESDFG